jgi:hypothetical protein
LAFDSIVNKLKLLKGVLASAQKTVRSNAVKTSRMPIYSTNDTTELICEGVMDSAKKEAAAWKIVASSTCGHAEKGVRAVYELDNTDICNGLRIKLTFSFSAGGTMAPAVIRVAGLSEAELPIEMNESPMLIVEVHGLCVGASVDPCSRDPGYIVFMRSTSKDQWTSSDQIFFEWYYEFVFRKFVNAQRTLYDGWEEGSPVEPELTAAGDATTLFVWTKDDLKDINNLKFRGCNTLEEKQYKMIAYAFEKAYDLAISPVLNVSRNPGFETPLGVFG